MVAGYSVKDDILIVLGIRKVVDTDPRKHNLEVKNAMIKLLRDELGLEVLSAGPRNALHESDLNLEESTELDCSTRRPAVVQRLKVTRKSLHHWLQRRVGAIRT